jgi:hypothetical protein
MESSDEVRRLRAEVARLARRIEALGGEVQALRRQADRGALAPRQRVRRAEAAELLHVSPATLAAWARDGRGPSYTVIGNRAWYRVNDLAAWQEHAERMEIAEPPVRREGPHGIQNEALPSLPGL